jgi:signal-transduction protein with cAMP-binding, CBS, and nucleotidyltransferase domain
MDTIRSILEEKGYEVHAVAPDATVLEAVDKMCAARIGALLVATPNATLGIVSERDIMARVILERRDPAQTRVERVMTRAVACVHVDDHFHEAMAVMTERCCRHLPVVAEGRIVGMISIGDLVRRASREQEFEIRLLTEYVRGGYR